MKCVRIWSSASNINTLETMDSLEALSEAAAAVSKSLVVNSDPLSTQNLRKQFKSTAEGQSNVYSNNCDVFQFNARKNLTKRLCRLNTTYRQIKTSDGRVYFTNEHNNTTKWDLPVGATVVQDLDEMPTLEIYRRASMDNIRAASPVIATEPNKSWKKWGKKF